MQDEDVTGRSPERSPGVGPLREALRRARVEAAERSDVVIDLRQAEIARLEVLQDALRPVFADVPEQIDIFDVGLVPGERPRLFVDMVAFIEMGRDRKLYRFLRDGRHGRAVVAESEHVQPIVDAVTAYVARRLVEREQLLADEERFGQTHGASTSAPPTEAPEPATAEVPPRTPARPSAGARWLRLVAILFAFCLGGGLGAAVVVGLMVAAAKGLLPGVG